VATGWRDEQVKIVLGKGVIRRFDKVPRSLTECGKGHAQDVTSKPWSRRNTRGGLRHGQLPI
jgi:hypothetical protein